MPEKFWGDTDPVVVYDAAVLLGSLYHYTCIDQNSRAYELLKELWLSTGDCPVFQVLDREFH